MMLRAALAPRSIAVVGASDNPHKVGGRPILPCMAVRLGDAMLGWGEQVASVDVNPVMLFEQGRGALTADALVECAPACANSA